MIKRLSLALGLVALSVAPALAGGACPFGHSYSQTTAEAELPLSTPADAVVEEQAAQSVDSAEPAAQPSQTTVAAALPLSQQQ